MKQNGLKVKHLFIFMSSRYWHRRPEGKRQFYYFMYAKKQVRQKTIEILISVAEFCFVSQTDRNALIRMNTHFSYLNYQRCFATITTATTTTTTAKHTNTLEER